MGVMTIYLADGDSRRHRRPDKRSAIRQNGAVSGLRTAPSGNVKPNRVPE
ncbi:hypothetical protein HMPREF1144_5305 [Klebsiella sp. OBRC7]|nr:hypothetical protein HMPREF1144_5305 [Klebsiella sp. OBRC7]